MSRGHAGDATAPPRRERSDLGHFVPSRFAALRRLVRVNPAAYARTRNFLSGAVSGLSPYFTHGFVSEAEAFACWRARFGVTLADRLGQELAWRCFFAHVRAWAGEAIFADLRPGLAVQYRHAVPEDVREARTGVPVIDATVRTLYATGYVHNHARLWLASYVVHLRKTHWRAGADWLYAHLLDGDLASNHLSWQWVAATFSTRPYLFNAENVAKYAPGLASPGTAIDTPYPRLAEIAALDVDVGPEPGTHAGASPPAVFGAPPGHANPELPPLAGRRVALVHPWALGGPPPGGSDFTLGVIHRPFHARFPWSRRRWAFVLEGMRRRCDAVWVGDLRDLARVLAGAEIHMKTPPEAAYGAALEGALVRRHPPPAALPDAGLAARSFSAYLKAIERRAPGLFRAAA